MKEYKYLAELSYVCGDIVKEIKQENILSIFLYIFKYYRNHRLYLYSKK